MTNVICKNNCIFCMTISCLNIKIYFERRLISFQRTKIAWSQTLHHNNVLFKLFTHSKIWDVNLIQLIVEDEISDSSQRNWNDYKIRAFFSKLVLKKKYIISWLHQIIKTFYVWKKYILCLICDDKIFMILFFLSSLNDVFLLRLLELYKHSKFSIFISSFDLSVFVHKTSQCMRLKI